MTAQPCGACHSTAHRITQCPQIARFDPVAELRDQLAFAHEALGCALALVRQQSYGTAEIVLEHALKGTTMREPEPPPPPEPENNPDKGGKPGDEGPSPL